MQDSPKGKPTGTPFLTLWIIWAAMAGSLTIYIAIPFILGDTLRQNMDPDLPLELIRNILLGLSGCTLGAAYFIRRLILKDAVGDKSAESTLHPNSSALLKKYTLATIIDLALSESIAIYGFVLFLLGDGLATLSAFVVISAVGMYFFRPKAEELEEIMDEGRYI